MPGDNWQKFANLRLLYGYMWTHPGKKLLFMGSEFAQWSEWSEAFSLDWHLVQENWPHGQMQKWLRALNHLYIEHPAMHEIDSSWEGFEWLEVHDSAQSILAYLRRNKDGQKTVIVACNFTPVVRHGYRIGVPAEGHYQLLLNSDFAEFGGSGVIEVQGYDSQAQPWQNQPASIVVTLPPLGIIILTKNAV